MSLSDHRSDGEPEGSLSRSPPQQRAFVKTAPQLDF
jgi:hypothetical protein